MAELKARLRTDLTASMKARDELRTSTLRMTLSALSNEEVSGTAAHELTDAEVLGVITREAKKRREAAAAFADAGRNEMAERERAEGDILAGYLPAQLDAQALSDLVEAAIAEVGAHEPRQMGAVMKVLKARVAGRADGKAVSDEVRRRLGG